jgi:drug/metabolite transporter (DMT)-like permease
MMAAASAAWAATTLVIKASALSRVSPEKTLLYQLVVCVPIVTLGAMVFGERIAATPSAVALGSLAYQTIVVGTTFSLWFRRAGSRPSRF